MMAVSQAPGVLGETMTLDLMGGGMTMGLRVRVLESRPVIVAGSVRHRLRLGLLGSGQEAETRVPEAATDSMSAEAL
jgi:hypothetical protein